MRRPKIDRGLLLPMLGAAAALAQNTGPINSPQINNVFFANRFPGADASYQINACLAAAVAAGGGTCDARGLGGVQTISQEIDVGASSGALGIELVLPTTMTWTLHGMTNPAGCGIRVYSSGTLTGSAVGAGGSRAVIKTDSSDTTMLAMLCTDPNPPGGGSYVRISGVALGNTAGTTFADGEVSITHLYDESNISYVFASNYAGDAWHVYSVCCGVRFDHIQGITGYSGTTGSGYPLIVGKSGYNTTNITILDSTFNVPANGLPDILITGNVFTRGINFINAYLEGNGAIDLTTPMVINYGANVSFLQGLGHAESITGILPNKPVFANYGTQFSVQNFGTTYANIGVVDYGSGPTATTYVSNNESSSPTNPIASIPFFYGGTYLGGSQFISTMTPTNILGAPNVLGNLRLSSLLSPGPVSPLPTATTGGTLSDNTAYAYRVTALNSAGETLPSTEMTVTTGNSGANSNTVTVEWVHVAGATSYKIYGRTAGAELLLTTIAGDSTIFWVDTGALTPAGAMPTADTTSPCLQLSLTGTNVYCINVSSSNIFQVHNYHDNLNDFSASTSSPTHVNAGPLTNAVMVNADVGSGTGGLQVYSGGYGTPSLWGQIDANGYDGAARLVSAFIGGPYPTLNWEQTGNTAAAWQDLGYNSYRGIFDLTNNLLREQYFPNSDSYLNGGATGGHVDINHGAGSGTGGLRVYSGGATPALQSSFDNLGNLYLSQGGGFYNKLASAPSGYRTTTLQDTSGVVVLGPVGAATASIGGSALAAGACTSGTASITNLTSGMFVDATPTTYPGDGFTWRAYVSTYQQATVKVCAIVAGTPTASVYAVRVIQ